MALVFAVAASLSALGQTSATETGKADTGNDVVLVAVATPDEAGSASSAPAPPPPSGSASSWQGFYAGANIGRAMGDAADTGVIPLPSAAIFVNLLPQTIHYSPTGPIGGLQMGYNWQRGRIVFGPEGDISAAGVQKTRIVTPIIQNNGTVFPGPTNGFGNNITAHQNMDAMVTARGRVGVTLGSRLLVYGTGGLAVGHLHYNANTDFRPVGTEQYPVNVTKTKTGWTAGGGVEVGVGKGWSVKGEYLRYELGGALSVNASPVPPLPPFGITYTWPNVSGNLFRFGVNRRF
ncbi:MAG TPA: outer membrane beta-barrel protein [Candidatus Angelobacter sp.]|nr:outer membrane beta-barrel protein [Candidatus Angelobacter sp.]